MKFRRSIFVVLMIWALMLLADNSRRIPVSINGRVPLGIETFRLKPANSDFYLMASVENSGFVGMQHLVEGEKTSLISADGKKVKFYPDKVQFRLTASAREHLAEDKPFDTTEKISMEDLLAKLRFRVKIFHGLDSRSVEPSYIDDIGMPKNVPYDERIYRIGFKLGKVPIEDRVVMEVISPSGERLCKFHLDLL